MATLMSEKCSIAVMTKEFSDEALVSKEYNADCNLRILDEHLLHASGGWMIKSSHEGNCRNILRDSLNALMTSLSHSGEIDRRYRAAMKKYATQESCSDEVNDEDISLPFSSMSGLFAIHLICMIFALIMRWRKTDMRGMCAASPSQLEHDSEALVSDDEIELVRQENNVADRLDHITKLLEDMKASGGVGLLAVEKKPQ
jgi:hypothetical protein